jgi:hypothetical protein
VKYGNNRAGRTSWRLFPLPIIENSSANGSLFDGLAKKQVLYRHAWSFRPKDHSKSLLGPYECKLQSWVRPLGHSSAVVAVVFLVIEKTGSQVFFLSLTLTDAALYCKNDLVSSQNALSTEDLLFIWFLANSATKFHILGKNDTFHINFEHLLLLVFATRQIGARNKVFWND